MPTYSYHAKSLTTAEPQSGVLESKNEHDLARILRQQGYILIFAQPVEAADLKKKIRIPIIGKKVSLNEKIFFTRNLRVMIMAGIPLPRALKVLSEQSRNSRFKKAILDISAEIIKGRGFAESLSRYPGIFSELFFSMVKVGEEGGTLEDVLSGLTKQMEREQELKSKIKGAMMYPIVIVCAMVLIGVVMMILVVPKLAQTFTDLGIPLPLTTQIIIGLASFLAKFWYLLPIIIIAFIALIRALIRVKAVKAVTDKLVLRVPLISPIIKKTNSAHTVRTLSSLINSGVPIVRALEVVAGTLTNICYKKAILDAAERVKKGAKLAEVLKKHEGVYPSLVIQMIEIGEETGETSSILEKLADFYEEEVANATKNLSSIIEPILMLLIGGAVGFFAVSMIQPMYSMIQAF